MKPAARQKQDTKAKVEIPRTAPEPCILNLSIDIRDAQALIEAHARWTGESGAPVRTRLIAQAKPQIDAYNERHGLTQAR